MLNKENENELNEKNEAKHAAEKSEFAAHRYIGGTNIVFWTQTEITMNYGQCTHFVKATFSLGSDSKQ